MHKLFYYICKGIKHLQFIKEETNILLKTSNLIKKDILKLDCVTFIWNTTYYEFFNVTLCSII